MAHEANYRSQMGRTTQKLRFKTFKSSVLKFWLIAIPALALAVWLGWDGWHTLHLPQNMKPFVPDPVVVGLCWFRMGFAAFLVIMVISVLTTNMSKSVTIAPEGLVCKNGKWEMDLLWKDAMVSGPPDNKRSFRTLLLSNGRQFYRVEEFFFPDYDLIARVVETAMAKEKTGSKEL